MYRQLMEQLNTETVVLTANRRLAAYLMSIYAEQQYAQQKTVWETPTILPFNTWLTEQWQSINKQQLLLNTEQEHALWEKVIKNTATTSIQHPSNAAKLAAQAWSMLRAWSLTLSDCSDSHNEEVEFFITIANEFQKQCQGNNWLIQADILQQLLIAIKNDAIRLPTKIILAGFDDLPPSTQQLLQLLKEKQCPVVQVNSQINPNSIQQLAAADNHAEIQLMARFAKQQLADHSNASIGCIVPQLTELRSQLDTIFTEVFCTESLIPGMPSIKKPFNISAGTALSQFNIAKTALQALQCCFGLLDINIISQLLQSPYLCQNDQDIVLGSQCDMQLRQLNEPLLSRHDLLNTLTRLHDSHTDSSWLTRWKTLVQQLKPLTDKRSPSQWALQFENLLQTWQWPGPRILNSSEYQVVKRFKQLLTDMAKLDSIIGDIKLSQAISLLQKQANSTLFQPQSHNEPIQVLGLLEAIGSEFDVLWVMGLSDEVWPPTAKPNPFLPYALQKKHHMPHASAERELSYCQSLMQRLLQSSKHIIFSHPQQQEDKECRASELLRNIDIISQADLQLPAYNSIAQKIMATSQLDNILDDQAPPINTEEAIQGGSWILKQQANCPFQAFANVRLHTDTPMQPRLGVEASQQGSLVHYALESIWRQLKSHANLYQLNDNELETLIDNTIADVFRSQPNSNSNRYFLSIEQQRLKKLLHAWLNLEKIRSPFKVIEQEGSHQIQLHGLTLHIKIDRIDQLQNGSQLVIDYKTGNTSVNQWFGERPSEPQLPLYAVYIEDSGKYRQFNALSIAEIRSSNTSFKGIVNQAASDCFSDDVFRGIVTVDKVRVTDKPSDWSQLLNEWRNVLNELSLAFSRGDAAVDPNTIYSCNYCDLHSLCRIDQ